VPSNTLLHPLTGAVLCPVGYRRDGRAIWPIMGGSEPAGDPAGDAGAGDAGSGTDGANAAGTAGTGGGAPAGDAQTAGQQQQAGDGLPTDPAELQRMIVDLRRENASARTTAKANAADEARAALAQDIGKALGLVQNDNKPPTPTQLTEALAGRDAELTQTRLEFAAYRAAGKVGADVDALLDSRAFATALGDLDPAADDFPTKLDALVKTSLDNNPRLRARVAAGASGVDHTGGTGEPARPEPTSIGDAVRNMYAGS
jgi:hypothetical protein